MELKDLFNIYISAFAATIALLSVGYQWWRDFLSTSPKISVMAAYDNGKLDVALSNRRNPTIVIEIGLCTQAKSGRVTNTEILSSSFHVVDDQGVKILSDVLNAGIERKLEPKNDYRVFVGVVGGKKFFSNIIALE